jgi:hypothetical protein
MTYETSPATHNYSNRRTRQPKPKPDDLLDLLRDRHVGAISLTDAAKIVGVAPSTAHAHFMATGEFCGIRVGQIGNRRIVSCQALRDFLGIDQESEK